MSFGPYEEKKPRLPGRASGEALFAMTNEFCPDDCPGILP